MFFCVLVGFGVKKPSQSKLRLCNSSRWDEILKPTLAKNWGVLFSDVLRIFNKSGPHFYLWNSGYLYRSQKTEP